MDVSGMDALNTSMWCQPVFTTADTHMLQTTFSLQLFNCCFHRIDRRSVTINWALVVCHTKAQYSSSCHKKASRWNASCLWVGVCVCHFVPLIIHQEI